MEISGVSEAKRNERPLERLVMWLRQHFCKHEFAIDDLSMTGIPAPEKPAGESYKEWMLYHKSVYEHSSHTRRVYWPCAKCGKLFYAHCGLDISPQHGPMFRREQPHNDHNKRHADTLTEGDEANEPQD